MSPTRPRRPRLRSLRLRVPVTAILVFAISLAVALAVAYELLLQDGRNDIDIVLAREQERFGIAMGELLADEELADLPAEDPGGEPAEDDVLRQAVRRYLALNPSNASYWTIVHFEDGRRLAAANGPAELQPLLTEDRLPTGEPGTRETLDTEAGEIRTSTVPVLVDGEQVATYQVVSPLAPIRAEALQAAGLLAAAAGLTLLLGGILLSLSLWRSLTPLKSLAHTARSTELRSLRARVDEPDTSDEVGQLAREFNTMLDRLEAASSHQREFMASVSHELRTPITIARGHLELLDTLQRDDPEAAAETVAILEDELARMGRLVDDLMAIARSEMDDFARPRDIDLVQWFEDLELRLAGLPLGRTSIEPPPPITLRADPDRLAQAVLNLIVNAHVHTPEDVRVTVRAETGDDEVVLMVEDDGPGIDPAIRDDVFGPFVRSGEVPTSTGLGLAVVRAVVDAHDGDIGLETGPTGTGLALRLPWTGMAADAIAVTEPRPVTTQELHATQELGHTRQLPSEPDDPAQPIPRVRR